ncbi:hypothetical protein DPEC_G00286990 [Dallia pectoralis]|uniref:Uncharacterized protein n=1 Tax=Dallia pectoralis TaxID=75939 RepID=A0ACC2FK78_DALPE|nr:hypothetical protein DPEC_G00286990 [Dallia pectoralis]
MTHLQSRGITRQRKDSESLPTQPADGARWCRKAPRWGQRPRLQAKGHVYTLPSGGRVVGASPCAPLNHLHPQAHRAFPTTLNQTARPSNGNTAILRSARYTMSPP